jgi:hypothetical protein
VSKFHRVTRTGTPPAWFIEHDGDSCNLPDVLGLEYIGTVLSGHGGRTVNGLSQRDVILTPLTDYQAQVRQQTRATSPGRLRTFINDTERRAKQAWDCGDKAEHDRLRLEISRVRAYQTANRAHAGKSRAFANETSRDVDAVRKAIERAITEIRKQSAGIADHFRATILYGGEGCWFYDGDNSAWIMNSAEREDLDPRTIRATWLGEQKFPKSTNSQLIRVMPAVPTMRDGRCMAERSCPYPPGVGGVCRTHSRMATLERARARGNVLRELTARALWDVCRMESGSDKSLKISRPAYTNRETFLSEVRLEKDCREEEAGGKYGSPEINEGDDREASDFESER